MFPFALWSDLLEVEGRYSIVRLFTGDGCFVVRFLSGPSSILAWLRARCPLRECPYHLSVMEDQTLWLFLL